MVDTNNAEGRKRVLVLGCTGSIGTSTLDIARNEPSYAVCGLTANQNAEKLALLGAEFSCPTLLASAVARDGLKDAFASFIAETRPDIIVNGIAGSAGLVPSIAALEAGVDLALANKESVVMAGPLIFALAKKNNCRILPVDSEHSAIFTLLRQCGRENVDRLVITASGGPFRTWEKERIKNATLADALKHPTWSMGTKITVDSASLGNKGLEVIEACRLFGFSADDVQVVVHPQSIVHSLVRTHDGAIYAQMSEPDMKHPIISALSYPAVRENFMKPFDLTDFVCGETVRTLTFEKPRTDAFPLLSIAFGAARTDGFAPIAFNAANEVAAGAFIEGKIGFGRIPEIVGATLDAENWAGDVRDLKDVFESDRRAREIAAGFISGS